MHRDRRCPMPEDRDVNRIVQMRGTQFIRSRILRSHRRSGVVPDLGHRASGIGHRSGAWLDVAMYIGQERSPPASGRPREADGGAAQKGPGLGTGRRDPRLLPNHTAPALSAQPPDSAGWATPMATSDKDLFAEEDDDGRDELRRALEELRVRLILALLGLVVGVVITFIPPLFLGQRVMVKMEEPAPRRLRRSSTPSRPRSRSEEADEGEDADRPRSHVEIAAEEFVRGSSAARPRAQAARPGDGSKGKTVPLTMRLEQSSMIDTVDRHRRADERR